MAVAHRPHAGLCRRRLSASLAGVCLLLSALLLSQQRLQMPSAASTVLEQPRASEDAAGTHVGAEATGDASIGGGADGGASCDLAVTPSQWADSCVLLTDACVDQGSIILYGEEHRMTGDQRGSAPYDILPAPDQRKYIFMHRNSTARDFRYAMPPIRVRPASSAEGTPYLAHPVFSTCTVPVVWYPMWLSNMAHVFRDNAAKLFGVLGATPWAPHIKLVLMTAEGHAAPTFNSHIMQPMVRLRMETWAQFTNRLPAAQMAGGYVPVDWQQPAAAADSSSGGSSSGSSRGGGSLPPASWEGGPQRCFRHMFVCNRGINITRWPLHGLGQHLVRHYSSQPGQLAPAAVPQLAAPRPLLAAGQPQQQPQPAAAAVGATAGRRASSGSSSGSSGSSSEEGVVRVVFHKRSSVDRQLLNAGELVERCNAWRHTTPTGRRLRAACREVEPTDVFSGIAAAQEADVFVGVHGANMANAWLMRPGSSMIELQPYGFDAGAAHLQYPLFNAEDSGTGVLWWLISVCDPAAWTPSVGEAAGDGRDTVWPKNRNLIVRWEALLLVLRTAVDMGGDMSQYRQRWATGRWWWFMGPPGSSSGSGGSNAGSSNSSSGGGSGVGMEYAGHPRRLRYTRKRCPAALAGDGGGDR